MDEIAKAVKYISLELKDNAGADKVKLIEEASQKFDLTPLQQEFLLNKFIYEK